MRPRTLSAILALALALAPAMALACGDCTDQLLESRQWWIWLVPFLVVGLLAEGALFTVVTWGRRIKTVSPRACAHWRTREHLGISFDELCPP